MKLNDKGNDVIGKKIELNCDCLAISGGWTPMVHLFTQSGGKLKFNKKDNIFVPDKTNLNQLSIGSAKGDFEKAMTENNLLSEPSDENVLIYTMFPEIGMNFLANVDNPDYFEPEPLDIHELTDSSYLVSVDDKEYSVTLKADNSVIINDGSQVNKVNSSPVVEAGLGTIIEAPLGGNIFRTIASEGDSVEADTTILILEAMKMETEIKAPSAGIISKIFVKPGDIVKPGNPLFEIQS